ncbi:hypothetical protein N7G274_001303 [Stereocaulon virgatum]|uniref:Transcription factor CBF/NF-Y/archaeal histone domain-containing protein n=1 Tax=Stereocaulon virgatum TaxID=373712 RepID=A0ABR4ARK0_9LECA
MDDFEGSYAPQSPDLSGFQSYDEPETFQNSYYPPQPQQTTYHTSAPSYLHQQPSNHDPFGIGQQQQTSQNPYQQIPHTGRMPAHNGKMKAQHADDEYMPDASIMGKGGGVGVGRKSKKMKTEEDYCAKPAPGVAEGIEVKTKFPVARIKRIMQADEDVGKVAQVTPTAVSKALELFMISVVTKAAAEARIKSSKRVTAAHLKAAVEKDEQLDFLADIIAKVPDAPTASKKEEKDDSEEGVDNGRRKKKNVGVAGSGGAKKRRKEDDEI